MASSFNCKGQNPKYVYRPVYFQCWGLGALPSALSIDLGPMVLKPEYAGQTDSCQNFTVVGGTMGRIPCTYTYAFTPSTGTVGVALTTGSFNYSSNTPTEIPIADAIDQNPLLTGPNGVPRWYVGGSGSLVAGSYTSWCNRTLNTDPQITTLEIAGTYETERCIGPIRIYYQGV